MRPGQYLSVKFAGFPARDLSPTVRFDGSARARRARLPHPALSWRTRVDADRRDDPAGPPRAGARAVRRRIPARGRWPAGPDRRRHRLGADLVGRGRGAARAASPRTDRDRGQPRRRRALHAPLARVADRRRRARGDRNRRDRRDQSGAARAADALPALARAGGHGLCRRPSAAGRCGQAEVARCRGALLCRSVPAERAAAVAHRPRHGDAAPACGGPGRDAPPHRARCRSPARAGGACCCFLDPAAAGFGAAAHAGSARAARSAFTPSLPAGTI